MAKDKDLKDAVKEAPESGGEKKAKDKEKDKDKDKSLAKVKKKGGIAKYFKDARAEFKKVVWPTPKATTNNTIVVIAFCLVAAVLIFGVDSLFGLINRLILG